jgi:hypothetical protein
VLLNAVDPFELADDDLYDEVKADLRSGLASFGELRSLVVPRFLEPERGGEELRPPPGMGKVFAQFRRTADAVAAREGLRGRAFDGRNLLLTFYDEAAFASGDLSQVGLPAKRLRGVGEEEEGGTGGGVEEEGEAEEGEATVLPLPSLPSSSSSSSTTTTTTTSLPDELD